MEQYAVPEYDAEVLTAERSLAEYFETAVLKYDGDPKRVSNWLMNDVLRIMNDLGVHANELMLTPDYLAEIIKLVDTGTVNTNTGKSLLEKVQSTGKSPVAIVEDEGLAKVSDQNAIRSVCEEVISENPEPVEKYRAGKESLIGWFVGQVMRKSKGKADPNLARQTLEDLLKKS